MTDQDLCSFGAINVACSDSP
jgi:RNA polymerase sigma factor (sigma-70 family)